MISKLFRYLLIDVLVAVLILACFALSFLDLDYFFSKDESDELSLIKNSAPTPTPNIEITESEDDSRTPWQIQFAEYFSDNVEVTETSYTSPNLSINISTNQYSSEDNNFTYYVADIYISSIECFGTFTSGHDIDSKSSFDILKINEFTDAIVSINGDTCCLQGNYFFIRNGSLYMDGNISDNELILFTSGEMRLIDTSTDTKESLLSSGDVYQIWHFGPSLLDSEGKALHPPVAQEYLCLSHPRTAIGYFEPGHYCFVVVDGRTKSSSGAFLEPLAEIFEDLGCRLAYNLDGGASSMLAFNGSIFSDPSPNMDGSTRSLTDTIYIKEP